MDCSTPGFPVLHYLLEFSQTRPLCQWCHPTVSSSVVPFSSCLPSFPASGSFPMSQFFTSGGQSIGASASASVLPMNIQALFPVWLTGLISLLPRGSQESSLAPQLSEWVSAVAQLCPTLCDPMDYSLPGSSLHGILQARILEWVAISFSRGSSWPRDWTRVFRIAGRRFNLWATRKPPAPQLESINSSALSLLHFFFFGGGGRGHQFPLF